MRRRSRTALRNDGARVGHLDDRHTDRVQSLRATLLVGENDSPRRLDRRVRETNAVLPGQDCDEQPLGLAVVGRHGDAAQAEGRLGDLYRASPSAP